MTHITKYKTENGKTRKANSAKGKSGAPEKNSADIKNSPQVNSPAK